ncbi:hypothetical protein BDB00DRAFT_943211 [Zychaea mexicana]|uniref:uncharacterized protein n=1 Tax=Zychaea mexicana TaxID=64656 RepID=UPI0022FE53CD|nr:uncharacterized protein BDB00DRAFT_943211 [Zychaea mexicana]KAI9484277.1 hypothetical protein BDB00DRAFT_943211 [Zychaea mexicana]
MTQQPQFVSTDMVFNTYINLEAKLNGIKSLIEGSGATKDDISKVVTSIDSLASDIETIKNEQLEMKNEHLKLKGAVEQLLMAVPARQQGVDNNGAIAPSTVRPLGKYSHHEPTVDHPTTSELEDIDIAGNNAEPGVGEDGNPQKWGKKQFNWEIVAWLGKEVLGDFNWDDKKTRTFQKVASGTRWKSFKNDSAKIAACTELEDRAVNLFPLKACTGQWMARLLLVDAWRRTLEDVANFDESTSIAGELITLGQDASHVINSNSNAQVEQGADGSDIDSLHDTTIITPITNTNTNTISTAAVPSFGLGSSTVTPSLTFAPLSAPSTGTNDSSVLADAQRGRGNGQSKEDIINRIARIISIAHTSLEI